MKKKIVLGALIVVGIMCAGLVLYALLKLSIAYEGVAPIMSAVFLVSVYAHTLVTKFKRTGFDIERSFTQQKPGVLAKRSKCPCKPACSPAQTVTVCPAINSLLLLVPGSAHLYTVIIVFSRLSGYPIECSHTVRRSLFRVSLIPSTFARWRIRTAVIATVFSCG